MNDVAAEVRDILVFHLGADERRLTDNARLGEDLGADSLDVVEIVMSCEERFAIEIPNRVATRLATVATRSASSKPRWPPIQAGHAHAGGEGDACWPTD